MWLSLGTRSRLDIRTSCSSSRSFWYVVKDVCGLVLSGCLLFPNFDRFCSIDSFKQSSCSQYREELR
uniref:Uncharacterized protein n=1 Tax=Lepeophtheirus salmonis TaxID=72036 RepID=A0A0K2VEI8_LEPSM